jgi:lantibiotic biosynthesis protein
MPLQMVLDAEVGIGYLENTVNDFTPLIDGIVLPEDKNNEKTIIWDDNQDFLFKKLKSASEQNLFEIELTETELVFDDKVLEQLPPSLSIMFRLLNNNDILLETVGGSSGVNLLGRFAHLDSEIHKISTEIAETEQKNNEDVIFAEIIHLPESRTGNVLLHPTFREYEIPYLAKSSLEKENQIELNDLYISVRNKHIYLRSKRLNKIIIPRLSNAHNYSNNALPIYQLLCDLQNQGNRSSIGFNWGVMANQYKFLPRVRIKNVIVHLATWKFEVKDFEIFTKKTTSETLLNNFRIFCNLWKIPQYFVLSEGDNELLIDCENELLVRMFINTLHNKSDIVLKEVLPTSLAIKNKKNESYSNQFVASIVRINSNFEGQTVKKPSISSVQRSFSIGSEWLYFKIYCGSKTADTVLIEAIKPLIEKCYELRIIEKSFFIRYNDPNYHIRVRFKLISADKIGELTSLFKHYISPFEQNGMVYKIQTDTYNRELERYGSDTIDFAESLFCEDSVAVLKFLNITSGDDRERLRWIFALKSVDYLLDAFNYTIDQKLSLIGECKESFAKEFKMNKVLKIQLDQRYRDFRNDLKAFDDINSELINILQERNKVLEVKIVNVLIQGLEKEIDRLMRSYIHMAINRVLTSEFRLQEMIIYDFLVKELKYLANNRPHNSAHKEIN